MTIGRFGLTSVLASVLALGLAAGGCSSLQGDRVVSTEPLTDRHGNVIGHRAIVREPGHDRAVVRVTEYVPFRDAQGRVIGYEEPTARGGAYLRDLQGGRIGVRHIDLRSYGTNPHGRGLTIVLRPQQPDRIAVAARPEALP